MTSDLKLEKSGVRIEGEYLFVNGHSFELNDPANHVEDNAGHWRRAMVHDANDTLIVNYADDYQGVIINGNRTEGVKIKGKLTVGGDCEFKQAPIVPDLLTTELGALTKPASLVNIIKALSEKIEQLENRVQVLETGS